MSENCILCFLSNFIKDEHNILTEKKAREFQPGCYQEVLETQLELRFPNKRCLPATEELLEAYLVSN